MNIQDKLEKLIQERVNALVSLKGIDEAEVSFNEEADFNNKYLFGDGTDLGIVNFLELYYEELNLLVERTATTPELHLGLNTTKTDWISQFESATTLAGDGSLYLDSNSDGVADDEINTSSGWLYQNGDQGENNSIADTYTAQSETAIGVIATDASDGRESGFIYASEAEALAAGKARALADRGSGLLGRRTQNADEDDTSPEITVVPEPFSGVTYEYVVGSGGVDHPHYFTGDERTNLLVFLSNVIGFSSNYYSSLLFLEEEIQKIHDEENILFTEARMNLDIDTTTELANIDTLKSDIMAISATSNNLYQYFSLFTAGEDISSQAGYVESEFNSKLTIDIPAMLSNIDDIVTNRVPQIETLIALTDTTLSLSYRKWLYFWIKESIQKPSSAYIGLNGIASALNSQENALLNTNSTLDSLLNDPDQYITQPDLIGAFFNPSLDETGTVLENRINILWIGTPAANKYKLFRAEKTDFTSISNDNWMDDYLLTWVVEVDEETGSIKIEYFDISFEEEKKYLYRIQSFDTILGDASSLDRIDSFNSSSLQSKIYDDDNEIIFSDITNGEIDLSEPLDLSRGSWVLIKTDDTLIEDFYLIENITEEKIILEEKITTGAGVFYKAFGIIQT